MKALIIAALMLFCVGCDRGDYVDVGPVLVDKTVLPESVEVK
jgi:ethanolamine utilization protein EutA (predicted chaperonin)